MSSHDASTFWKHTKGSTDAKARCSLFDQTCLTVLVVDQNMVLLLDLHLL